MSLWGIPPSYRKNAMAMLKSFAYLPKCFFSYSVIEWESSALEQYKKSVSISKYGILSQCRTNSTLSKANPPPPPLCHLSSTYQRSPARKVVKKYNSHTGCVKSSPYFTLGIQGGSDISGTTSELRRCIKNRFFILIILLRSISYVCRNVNRNKQTH